MTPKTILITGGTGLLGMELARQLKQKGYRLLLLSRSGKCPAPYDESFIWDVNNGTLDERAIQSADAIIHLAGEGIADQRWTEKRKQEIIDSRVKSIELLKNAAIKLKVNPIFISASAIGFYGGVTSEKVMTEEDAPATDFLGTSCRMWEEAADTLSEIASRVVKIRIGIVLSDKGGALPKMATPVKMGVGAALGSGKQYVPWVHIQDIARVFIHALESEKMQGVYNAVAGTHCTNRELAKTIAKVLKRPFWPIPVPSFALKILFGEMSAAFLEGSPVSNQKLIQSGFHFNFPELDAALKNLLIKS
ncbi:MAG: TIGR01777 family oxidoreductase [Flavobacteriales bacterium]